MQVEKLKYTIWAADAERAARFYQTVFGATISGQNPHITELSVAGGLISIHGGGEGKQTWTGLTFQVADVVAGAAEVVAAGGKCERAPQPENGEPPHLAMCEDTDGNQIMLSRARKVP
jgi:lactoylglutathione lyase